jgi:hypothetical protein
VPPQSTLLANFRLLSPLTVLPVLSLLSFSQPMAKDILLVSSFYFFFSFYYNTSHQFQKRVGNFNHWQFLFTANPLSISTISSQGGATCTFFGIDGSQTTVVGAETDVPVGPPQTQISGVCDAL